MQNEFSPSAMKRTSIKKILKEIPSSESRVIQYFFLFFLFITILALGLIVSKFTTEEKEITKAAINSLLWTTDGVLVTDAPDYQLDHQMASDGAGGVIIAWVDARNGNEDIYAQRLDSSGNTKWQTNGVVICNASNNQNNPRIISDGIGGAIVVWEDERDGAGPFGQIYIQRINSSGVTQWTNNGVTISIFTGENPEIISDGSDGAIITFTHFSLDHNIIAQRIDGSGTPQWGIDPLIGVLGVSICGATDSQWYPQIASDGTDGAIITWHDDRSIVDGDTDVYAQRVNASGEVQWEVDGIIIADTLGEAEDPKIISSDSNSAIITWRDIDENKTYIQKIDGNGNTAWTPFDGVVVHDGLGALIISDGTGGAILTWEDENADIYTQRFNNLGESQWGTNGKLLSTATGDQKVPHLISDNTGGAIITWYDNRKGSKKFEVFAQKIDSQGNLKWDTDGTAISNSSGTQTAIQSSPRLVTDQAGGANIAWIDQRAGNSDIYAQKITSLYQISNLSAGLDAQDISGNDIEAGSSNGLNGFSETVRLKDHDNGLIITDVEVAMTTDRTWASVIGDTDASSGKSVIANLLAEPGTSSSHSLFVPIPSGTDHNAVLICPNATDLSTVQPGCTNSSVKRESDADTGKVTIETQEYWQITGLTSSGGSSVECSTSADCAQGEYCRESDYTCQDLPTCAEANPTLGYNPQENDEDLWNDCTQNWRTCDGTCTRRGGDGACEGGTYSCDENDRVENIASGYVCTGLGNTTVVSSMNYCYYDESCDAGECSATKWWTSCNGSGSCRLPSDHTDSHSEIANAPVNKVLSDDCANIDATAATSCDGSVDYYSTAGACTYLRRYAECNGSGSCDTNSSIYYEEASEHVPNGNIATNQSGGSSPPYESPSVGNYCQTDEDCNAGDCSASRFYRACSGSGNCRSDNVGAASETIYASQGYTLTDSCSTNGTSSCGYGSWRCNGACRRSQDIYRCSASHTCNYTVGANTQNCQAATSCSNGTCSASSLCNASWVYCPASGDNNYNAGGQYFCQGSCDGANNCDYATNCNFNGLIINLTDSLSAQTLDLTTNEDVTVKPQNGVKKVGVLDTSNNKMLAEVNVDFSQNRDWENVTGKSDIVNGKSVISNIATAPGASSTHTLYVPITKRGSESVVICPNASDLSQVTQDCSQAVIKTESDPDTSKIIIDEQDYWKITGLTASGGLSVLPPTPSPPTPNEAPTIEIIEPNGVDDSATESFTITWTDSDPDDNAFISLYYDDNNTGEDGNLIIEEIQEDAGEDQYTWNISDLAGATYYIYAVIEDTTNDPVIDYSSGPFTKIVLGCTVREGGKDEEDSDCDGMPDYWEEKYGLDPQDPTDAGENLDIDGCINLDEYKNQSHPLVSDCNLPEPQITTTTEEATDDSQSLPITPITGSDPIALISDVNSILGNQVHSLRDNEKLVSFSEDAGTSLSTLPATGQLAAIALSTGTLLFLSPANLIPALLMLVRREKRNHWGIVYDLENKTPIPFAVIRLERSGSIITKVTDLQGRYNLVIQPGKYTMKVNHSEYDEFESQVEVKENGTLSIDSDIGLHPKEVNAFLQIFIIARQLLNRLFERFGPVLLFLGFAFSLSCWIVNQNIINFLITLLYLPMFYIAYRQRTQYPNNWGRVISSATTSPVNGAFVKIFTEEAKGGTRLLDTAITNFAGRYGFLLEQSGDYLILVAATNYTFPSKKSVHETYGYGGLVKVKVGKDKVYKKDLLVDPSETTRSRLSPFST